MLSFAKFALLQDVPTLQIIHQVSLEHPGILVGAYDPIDQHATNTSVPTEENKSKEQQSDVRDVKTSTKDTKKKDPPPPLQSFMLLPPNLTPDVKSAKCVFTRANAQENLLNHVIKFCNQTNHNVKELEASAYLDVKVSTDQQAILNPTVLDTITGFIIKDAKGERAKKKLVQRRLNLIDGTINSHCCLLNSN